MLQLKVGDIVFSHSKGFIRAVGVVTDESVESPRPDFGSANSMWESDGWEALVAWEVLPTPINPRDYLEILNENRQKNLPMTSLGKVNMQYLFSIPDSFGQALSSGIAEIELKSVGISSIDDETSLLIREAQEIVSDTGRTRTERQQLVAARLGQGMFKDNVSRFEPVCRVTGVAERRHLIASHIKPWRDSDNAERLDGANGLLLSPHVDHLFDRGFISFRDSGSLMFSPQLSPDIVAKWAINRPFAERRFRSSQTKFLEYHRDVIFKSA